MTLFSSKVGVMTAIIASSAISTINTTGSTTQLSMSICADSPSSTACMMAIEDDETGNDTICYVQGISLGTLVPNSRIDMKKMAAEFFPLQNTL